MRQPGNVEKHIFLGKPFSSTWSRYEETLLHALIEHFLPENIISDFFLINCIVFPNRTKDNRHTLLEQFQRTFPGYLG